MAKIIKVPIKIFPDGESWLLLDKRQSTRFQRNKSIMERTNPLSRDSTTTQLHRKTHHDRTNTKPTRGNKRRNRNESMVGNDKKFN
jgi:hypothetical protein